MKQYIINGRLKDMTSESRNGDFKYIIILSAEEFYKEVSSIPHKSVLLRDLTHIEYTRAELFGTCILGTICIPVMDMEYGNMLRFGFYISENRLYMIGDAELLLQLLNKMKETSFPENISICGFFCCMLNSWLDDDVVYLQKIEDILSDMEDALLDKIPEHFYKVLIPYRKSLLSLQSYYYQMMNLGMAIRSNANLTLDEEDQLSFSYFSERAGRLHDHVKTLREYVLQIREMYQTQIELRQSKSMNLLTVVSAIFLPLTLLAGWYGMNFANMPELTSDLGYPGVITAGIITVIAEIIFFKRNHLL